MVIQPKLLEQQARRNGLIRVDVAQTMETGFQGRTVGFYREPGSVATELPFGFMTLLGILSVVGEQIKNSIVVLDKVKTEIEKGKEPYIAILDGSVTKFRPVLMVAITTALGMAPLLFDPFFASNVAALMFGLLFACVLIMIEASTLYCILFGIHDKAP